MYFLKPITKYNSKMKFSNLDQQSSVLQTVVQNNKRKRVYEEDDLKRKVSRTLPGFRFLSCKIGNEKSAKTDLIFPSNIPTKKNGWKNKHILKALEKNKMEVWVPAVVATGDKEFDDFVYKNYEVSNFCRRRNLNHNKDDPGVKGQISFSMPGKKPHESARTRVTLQSFFPEEITTNDPKELRRWDADHIDCTHTNNVLSNLQWLTKSENSSKGTSKPKKSLVEKQGKKCQVVDVRGNGDRNYLDCIFNSLTCAAKELGLARKSIFSSCRNGHWTGCYKFKFVEQQLLEGEEFKKFGDYEVSNKGRIKNSYGKITDGTINKRGKKKTKRIRLLKKYLPEDVRDEWIKGDKKGRLISVHHLVWSLWSTVTNDTEWEEYYIHPPPKRYVIMHDDRIGNKVYNKDGTYKNWSEHLTLGLQKENMDTRAQKERGFRKFRCVNGSKQGPFISGSEAASYYNVRSSSIFKCCRKNEEKGENDIKNTCGVENGTKLVWQWC